MADKKKVSEEIDVLEELLAEGVTGDAALSPEDLTDVPETGAGDDVGAISDIEGGEDTYASADGYSETGAVEGEASDEPGRSSASAGPGKERKSLDSEGERGESGGDAPFLAEDSFAFDFSSASDEDETDPEDKPGKPSAEERGPSEDKGPAKFAKKAEEDDDGTDDDDFIHVTAGDGDVKAKGGDDKIITGKGDDTVDAGDGDDFVQTGHGDDIVAGGAGDDVVKTKKGDDFVDAGDGDDLVVSGHGDDKLDGGSGDDVLNGGKGDDTLVYTLAENVGGHDQYDGGKGFDTLELRLTVDEFNELREELIELNDWIADHSNVKASSGVKFNDKSKNGSDKHDVFETSFGLDVRYMEDMTVVVDGYGEVGLEADLDPIVTEPEPEPEPEPELSPELVEVDVAESVEGDEPVSLTLAKGSTTTVSVNVEVKDVPPMYDVFMVQDLSGSFYNDLPNVKSLLPSLMENLSAENDVAFGVGSFVDKAFNTFGWGSDYAYKTDQAISTDFDAVQAAMDALRTYSGYDYPESQLEALVQSALRGDEIGFRDGAQKYVVLSTDAAYHKEGDFETTYDAEGNLIEVPDNDYDTDLEMEDYPDMTVVGELLEAAGITPVFAVTSYVMPIYQDLVDAWGFGTVVELASDSSNIVEAITTGIEAAAVDLTLDVTGDDYGYVSGMTPEVYPDAGPGMYTFDITIDIPEDTSGMGSDGLSVAIPGYGTIDLDIAIAGMDMTGDDGANDTLVGDDGNNIIDGLGGDDVLTGGLGDDTFVFETGHGKDTVTDFNEGDQLDLRRVASVTTAADVLAAASQVGVDTVIDFGDGDTLTLENVDVTSLSADDMVL